MPTVRRWNPQVEQAPLPGPRMVVPDTSGYEAVAKGLGQVAQAGKAVFDVNQQELEDARKDRLTEAYVRLARERMVIEDSVKQVDGKAALEQDLVGETRKRLDEAADKISGEFTDPVLVERFQKHRLDQSLQLEHTTRGHVSQQAESFRLQSYKDALDVSDLDAQRAAMPVVVEGKVVLGDPGGLQAAIERKRGAIEARRAEKGDAWVKAETAAQLGVLHAGVIQSLTSGEKPQPQLAVAYLNEHRADMAPALVSKIEKDLMADVREDAGGAVARGFVARATDATGRYRYDQAKAELDAYLASDATPSEKKAATSEFTAASLRAEKGFASKVDSVGDLAMTKIGNAGYSLKAAREELRWLRREDVGQGQLADAIEARVKNILEEQARGPAATPAQKSAMVDFYLSLPTRANEYASKPEAFKQSWYGKLSEKDLVTASAMVAQFGVAARKPDESLPPTVIAAVTALGHQAGKWAKTGPKNDDQKMAFYGLTAALLEEQARLKTAGPVKPDDLVAFARKKLVSGTAYTSTGGEETGITELDVQNPNVNPGLAGAVFISDENRKRYEEKLRGRGLPVDSKDWLLYLHMSEQPGVDASTLPISKKMQDDLKAAEEMKARGKAFVDPKTGEYTGRTR